MRIGKGVSCERNPVADHAFEWVATSVDARENVVNDDAASAGCFGKKGHVEEGLMNDE